MLTLQPGNSFTIVRQIENHLDLNTYYVRAVIRDAYSDSIIGTVDLENKGGQRFRYNWTVPNDPSGQGFYISIVTSVYSDSGYTTKSENYGDNENTYLVQDRILIGRIGGNSGGVDSFDVRKIIKEELLPIKNQIASLEDDKNDSSDTDDQEESMKLNLIYETLTKISDDLTTLKNEEKTEPEEKDYTPMLEKITNLLNELKDQELKEDEIKPILDAIADLKTEIEENEDTQEEKMKEKHDALQETLIDGVNKVVSDILENKKFILDMPQTAHMVDKKEEEDDDESEDEPKKERDLSKLSL